MEKKAYQYRIVEKDSVEKCFFCDQSINLDCVSTSYEIRINQIVTIFLHLNCLIFSEAKRYYNNDRYFGGYSYQQMKIEKVRSQKFDCCICKRKGAFVKCAEKGCGNSFHLPCGVVDSSKTLHPCTTFKSRCPEHSYCCSICLEDVTGYVTKSVCNPSCCANKAFFHEDCVRMAIMAAGRLVECVNCKNVDKFKKEAMESGMVILCRNPSYAEEPQYSYVIGCTATVCFCKHPSGRLYHVNSGKSQWEIVTCIYCGHGSIHRKCGRLERHRRWTCNSCIIESSSCSAASPNVSSSSVDTDDESTVKVVSCKRRQLEDSLNKIV